jgi:ribosomal protein S18 acetylase RimI-like enzyme
VNWRIERVTGADLDVDEVIAVYRESGLGERRPVADRDRFRVMLDNANLVLVCRTDQAMVGIARSVSDFAYTTYLSDLAVIRAYQRKGIGQELIAATRKEAPHAKIVLLSAPAASAYYPHIGFSQHDSAWVLNP